MAVVDVVHLTPHPSLPSSMGEGKKFPITLGEKELSKNRSCPQSPSPRRATLKALGSGLMWITPLGDIPIDTISMMPQLLNDTKFLRSNLNYSSTLRKLLQCLG